MPRLCELIEEFIKEMIRESNGVVEIQRNELASKFNCVPSQINYVISTRFTVERGYYVESKRGGGGHIRIKEVNVKSSNYLMHLITSIGNSITQQEAEAFITNLRDHNIITEREALILKAGINDKVFSHLSVNKDLLRANILKNMLISIV